MTAQTKLATVARAVADAPVVSPLAELLQHRTTIVIIVGVLMLLGLPYYPGITPARVDLLTNVIIGAMGLLGVRFSVEGVMQTRADLSQLVRDVEGSVSTPSGAAG
jgi:hypothetical protein